MSQADSGIVVSRTSHDNLTVAVIVAPNHGRTAAVPAVQAFEKDAKAARFCSMSACIW